MTEQPAEPVPHFNITTAHAARAMVKLTRRQSVVDEILAKLPASMARPEAEDQARRIALSSLVCIEAGIPVGAEQAFYWRDDWQEALTKMLRVYDETDKPEVMP